MLYINRQQEMQLVNRWYCNSELGMNMYVDTTTGVIQVNKDFILLKKTCYLCIGMYVRARKTYFLYLHLCGHSWVD